MKLPILFVGHFWLILPAFVRATAYLNDYPLFILSLMVLMGNLLSESEVSVVML
jgi:hypothetical protein